MIPLSFSEQQFYALCILGIFILSFLFFLYRLKSGKTARLRPIKGFESIKTLVAHSIETGKPLHVTLGTGSITDQTTADSLAGSTETKKAGSAHVVTMADPTVMLLAHSVSGGQDKVRWVSPEPTAYAAGVMGTIGIEDTIGNVMIGNFGDEYLLMGEALHWQRKNITAIAGASKPDVISLVLATSPQGIWGENMFAGGAYLAEKHAHLSSLFAQDTLRWLIAFIIIGGVIATSIGLLE